MSINPNQNPVGTDTQDPDYNVQSDQLPIKIDRNCYTCSVGTNQGTLKNAFKMACLLYQPQPVEFAGRRFNKDKLLT